MNITEVKVTLVSGNEDRLKAFCSVTFDAEFVVRDLKVISGPKGLFLAMPSRRLTVRCNHCSSRIEADARYCSNCGRKTSRSTNNDEGWRPFSDIAHPINAACRAQIEAAVMEAYEAEMRRVEREGHDGKE